MRSASNATVINELRYTDIKIGGGGHFCSMEVADDGTLIARTDTNNGFIRGPSDTAWRALLRYGDNIMTFPQDDPAVADWGTVATTICATDSDIAYWFTDGYIWKTTDGTATATRTAFPRYQNEDFRCNVGQRRLSGSPMVVDPFNGSIVYIGLQSGVKYTLDGGATWTTIGTGTIPAPTAGKRITICFNRFTATSGGRTQDILIGVPGSGIYRTTNAGTTWALIASQPAAVIAGVNMIYAHKATGNIYVCGDGEGNPSQMHRYMSGTWTAVATATESGSISMKPTDNTKMYSFQGGGAVQFSGDNGVTWGAAKFPLRSAPNVPWLAWTNEVYMGHSASVYMPTEDSIVIASGTGPWKYSSLQNDSGGGNHTVNAFAEGVENLACHMIIGLDGGCITASEDRAFFCRKADQLDVYPVIHGVYQSGDNLQMGTCIDYAIDDHDFLVGFSDDNLEYSTNRGQTSWQVPTTDWLTVGGTSAFGGNVAVGNKNNWVVVGFQNGSHPVYTLDGGVTFNNCNIGGNLNSYYSNSYVFKRRIIVADKDTPGTFYIYNSGELTAATGIWKTTNGGANWTRMRDTVITPGIFGDDMDFYNGTLSCVQPGHLWWSAGNASDGFYRSTDSGATWSAVSGAGETYCYGFGTMKPGGTYRAYLRYGYRGATFGWWFSEDAGATETQMTIYDYGAGNVPSFIDGCDTVYGRFFLAPEGRSFAYVDLIDKATC